MVVTLREYSFFHIQPLENVFLSKFVFIQCPVGWKISFYKVPKFSYPSDAQDAKKIKKIKKLWHKE